MEKAPTVCEAFVIHYNNVFSQGKHAVDCWSLPVLLFVIIVLVSLFLFLSGSQLAEEV